MSKTRAAALALTDNLFPFRQRLKMARRRSHGSSLSHSSMGALRCTALATLDFTAWASVGGEQGVNVYACIPVVSQSSVRSAVFLPGGAVGLELVCLWLHLVLSLLANVSRPFDLLGNWLRGLVKGLPYAAMRRLPMKDLDEVLTGARVPFFQDALQHPAEDGVFWSGATYSCDLKSMDPGTLPGTHIVTGWHDFFSVVRWRTT